jgi:hypothetical protein
MKKKLAIIIILLSTITTKAQNENCSVLPINYDSIIDIVSSKIYFDFPFLMNLDAVIKQDVREYSYATEMKINNIQNINMFCLTNFKRYKKYRKCMLNNNNITVY